MSDGRDERVRHPIAARLIERTMREGELRGQADHRRRLLAGLAGRVVELGAGSGTNFQHYPASVTEVVAVEPEAYLRRVALAAAEAAPVQVKVVDGVSGKLPLEDASCDAGVASLVLCSVPDQERALAELARVIRPGGSSASMSTSSLITRLQPGSSASPTPLSGRWWQAAATAAGIRWRRSSGPGSSSRPASASPSARRRCYRPIRTSWAAPAGRDV